MIAAKCTTASTPASAEARLAASRIYTDDFIPALAGPQLDHNVLQVEREAFAGDTPPPTTLAAPAHQRAGDADTADAIDASESRAIREQITALDRFVSEYLDLPGGRSTEYLYQGRRLPAGD